MIVLWASISWCSNKDRWANFGIDVDRVGLHGLDSDTMISFWREDLTLKIYKRLEKYIKDLDHSTYCQLVLSWKPTKLIMVGLHPNPLIRSGKWSDHSISWWLIKGSVSPRSLEKKHCLWRGMMDYARLMVIRTIILRESVAEKIPHWKYVKDLRNIYMTWASPLTANWF